MRALIHMAGKSEGEQAHMRSILLRTTKVYLSDIYKMFRGRIHGGIRGGDARRINCGRWPSKNKRERSGHCYFETGINRH